MFEILKGERFFFEEKEKFSVTLVLCFGFMQNNNNNNIIIINTSSNITCCFPLHEILSFKNVWSRKRSYCRVFQALLIQQPSIIHRSRSIVILV